MSANVRSTTGTHLQSTAVLSSDPLKGATVSRTMVGGQHANVVELPLKCPLKEHEIRKLRHAGFQTVAHNGEVYYCRHERWTESRWVKDCFAPTIR